MQQNPPNYLTDLPARRKMHRQLCSRLSAQGPNTSRHCSEPLCEASGRKASFPLSLAPLPDLGIIWRQFGGALAGPYLSVHVSEHPIGPPSGACALDAVSMVTAAPGPGKSSWMLELAGPTSPPGSARNLTGSVQERQRGGEREPRKKPCACWVQGLPPTGCPPNRLQHREGEEKQ